MILFFGFSAEVGCLYFQVFSVLILVIPTPRIHRNLCNIDFPTHWLSTLFRRFFSLLTPLPIHKATDALY